MSVLPEPDSSYAVLIGVHDYTHLEGLPAVAANLSGLQGVLADREVWGLPDDRCTVLSQPDDAAQVLDAVGEAARRARDTLLVYYAGHGLTDPYSDELYLALPASKHDREYTWLRYEYLRRAVLDPAAGARRTVVILDCCYSGRALVGRMSASEKIADHAMVEGSCLFTASAETRTALSPPGETYTAFSGELIAALSEGIPGAPDPIDMHSLYRHLHGVLAAKSRPLPQQRNRNAGGLIALARNRAVGRRTRPEEGEGAASAGRNADVAAGVGALGRLMAEYVELRRNAPSGPARTAAQERIFAEMLNVVPRMHDSYFEGLLTSDDAGRRLASVAHLCSRPNPEKLIPLVEMITSEPLPFLVFAALVALDRVIDKRGPGQVPYGVVEQLRAFASKLPVGSDRANLLRLLLTKFNPPSTRPWTGT